MIKDLEEIIKNTEDSEFIKSYGAEKVRGYTAFTIECPHCHQKECLFDFDAYLCKACKKSGTFDELKQLVIADRGAQPVSENHP
jgi:hypothetical protein